MTGLKEKKDKIMTIKEFDKLSPDEQKEVTEKYLKRLDREYEAYQKKEYQKKRLTHFYTQPKLKES